MFTCKNVADFVPYTLVCGHRPDCSDHSDEDFCVFPRCSASFHCGNNQCIPEQQFCDHNEQCVNGVDESRCPIKEPSLKDLLYSPPAPGVVNFNAGGKVIVTSLNASSSASIQCPLSHFACPGRPYFCLPVFLRCNNVLDCPRGEDELACDRYTCPGMYHCRGSHVCVHVDHLCDGLVQCPQQDDELFCHLSCPRNCSCHAHAFFCPSRVSLGPYHQLRFLEGKGSGMTPADVFNKTYLIHLSLVSCGLRHLDIPTLDNLLSLDVSDNYLVSINTTLFHQIKQLSSLRLAGNPLAFRGLFENLTFSFLQKLDLSRIKTRQFNVSILTPFPDLRLLNLSNNGISTVSGDGFQSLTKLEVLHLRGCPMIDFPRDLFQGLADLHVVHTDNYKLCCPGILPTGFVLRNCVAPSDEISSCQTLLQSNVYRVILACLGAVSLLCNLASFLYRACNPTSRRSGFAVFVIHLSVSDFLMGVYLAVIGVADRLYHGTYAWRDTEWRHSVTCQMAGLLSFLSNEVSAFLVCLITLDRFLVLRFPFSQLHFHHVSSHVACALVWCLGLILASVPLLPFLSHWNFYSQTGICIPLPITRKQFTGQRYSFSIIIVLNFVLFMLIAVGQCIVYWSIQTNTMSTGDGSRKSKDQTIARRLLTIVLSDFLCWFPVGLMGLLASKGVAIPSEVSVTMAIIVIPLNASLNPFLYTLNILQERRRKVEESRIEKRLMSQLQAKYYLHAKSR